MQRETANGDNFEPMQAYIDGAGQYMVKTGLIRLVSYNIR